MQISLNQDLATLTATNPGSLGSEWPNIGAIACLSSTIHLARATSKPPLLFAARTGFQHAARLQPIGAFLEPPSPTVITIAWRWEIDFSFMEIGVVGLARPTRGEGRVEGENKLLVLIDDQVQVAGGLMKPISNAV